MNKTVTRQNKETSARILHTVNQFSQKHPAFSIGGLRWQIFNSATNGLNEFGAIVRLSKRVLIDEGNYFLWVDSQQERKVA